MLEKDTASRVLGIALEQVARTGRSGICDVTVLDGATRIARFRSASPQIEGQLVADPTPG